MSAPIKHTIIISPIGAIKPAIQIKISRAVEQVFGCQTENRSLIENADFAYDPIRDQHLSTLILEKLTASAPLHACKILALCEIDLYIPILTYVFGEAQLAGKSCIVSLFRLKNGAALLTIQPEVLDRRAVKEAVHELGHTFGLHHCPDESCLMHYCRSIDDVDRKSDQFCRYCRIMLDDEIKRLEAAADKAIRG